MVTKREQRRRQSLQRHDEQFRATAAELAEVGYVLQGSITKRWMTCGQQACRCTTDADARHGPYYVWTAKRSGKTKSVYLTAEQAAACAQWIENTRRLERLVAKLRQISRRIAKLEQIPDL
jgi:hypothetical protein